MAKKTRRAPQKTVFIGIDPGKQGALAVINEHLDVLFMARTPKTTAGMADVARQAMQLGEVKLAVLERTQAMSGNGVVAMHSYGRQAGTWEGILVTLGVPLIQPYRRVWQALVSAPGCRRGVTKKRSIASAKRLFGVTLKKSQDGIADALHMALWALHVYATGGM